MTGMMSAMVAAALVVIMMLLPGMDATPFVHKPVATIPTAFPRRAAWLVLRGGADVLEEEDEYDDFESEDEMVEEDQEELEEFEEEEEEVLAKSAVKATQKARAKKTAATKKAVSSAMAKKKKSRKSILQLLRVPYIIRASLNPFTLIAMTKGYFGSLFNLHYLEEDSSQGLRSALEEKAKKEGSSGKRKGKRTMRPGQAKTLSDLPQLNT